MLVKTGFGYYVKDGKKIGKYHLPIGQHPDPSPGIMAVEVSSKKELDNTQLDPKELTEDQAVKVLEQSIQEKRNAFIDALIAEDKTAQEAIKADVVGLQAQKADLVN